MENKNENKMENKSTEKAAQVQKTPILKRLARSKAARIISVAILIVLVIVSAIVAKTLNSRVYTDQADIEAPTITLSPTSAGVLQKLFVNVGDHVNADTVVA